MLNNETIMIKYS